MCGGSLSNFLNLPVSVPPAVIIGKILPTLNKNKRAALFNLSYVGLPPNISKDDLDYDAQVALAITQTNGIAAGTRDVGVFPNISRMNHGCSRAFNAVYSWREREQKMVVYAIRPIKQGQEILTAYFDTRRPRSERRFVRLCVSPFHKLGMLTPRVLLYRAYLQDHYDFRCSCEVCSLPDEVSATSDERLSRMQNMQNELAAWAQGQIDGEKAIHLINEIWWVGSLEKYWSQRGRLAADAVMVALAHSE